MLGWNEKKDPKC
jgi:hypothetical protein